MGSFTKWVLQGLVQENLHIFKKIENADKVNSMFRTSPKESILSGIHFRLAKEQFSESLSLKIIVEIPLGKYVYSTNFVVVDESRGTCCLVSEWYTRHRVIFNIKGLNTNIASNSFTKVNQADVIELVKNSCMLVWWTFRRHIFTQVSTKHYQA